MRWYGNVLKINKNRTAKTVLNVKLKGNHPRGKA
jgi:hypothetical protein